MSLHTEQAAPTSHQNKTKNRTTAMGGSLSAFGIFATIPPPIDPQTTMQRGDEINNIQRMLRDGRTSTIVITGSPGVGKSTLAALLFQRLLLAKQQGMSAPRHAVWLTIDSYTTLPDLIAAILKGVGVDEPGLFLLKPEQQISTLLRALRRPQENALIVLDQFESFLYPEHDQGSVGRGAITSFLGVLQTDLGASRVLLTSYQSPFEEKEGQEARVRSYLVSRISLPEGLSLLQQRGVTCAPEDLSLIWQRCTGHVYSLVLFSALTAISQQSADVLLKSSPYQILWSGDVTRNLITSLYHACSLMQRTILQALSLFHEPAPLSGLIATIMGNQTGMMDNDRSQFVAMCEREAIALVNMGLVQPTYNIHGDICFTLHSLVRQFVQENFLEQGDQPPAFLAHMITQSGLHSLKQNPLETARIAGHAQVAQYYQQVIKKLIPPRQERQSPLDILPVIYNIRHLCQARQWQQACTLLFEEELHEAMIRWGSWNALLGLYVALLPPLGQLPPADTALVTSHVAMLYGRLGENQPSKTSFEKALAIYQQIQDPQGEAMTLTNQGELLRTNGHMEQAQQCFEKAIELLNQHPNDELSCVLQHNLGLLFQQTGDHEQALYYYTESFQIASRIEKQAYIGLILSNMGMLLYEHGEHREGIALLLAAVRIREMQKDPSLPMLERFLVALEQKMGSEAYTALCREALDIQPLVFSRFAPPDTRH